MRLTLVRHALPERDAADRTDPGLSATGREQARRLADFLAGEAVDAVYTSPQRRAAETAAAIGERVGRPVGVLDGLAEFDHGAGEYLHFDDLYAARDPRFFACMAGDLSPWGTDRVTFARRYSAAIAEIADRHPDGDVVAVTHGGVLNGYLAGVLGIERLFFFDPHHTGICRVRITARRTELISVNESGHLPAARLERTT
jgi:probable phosphoglycerate mutase